ncbi:MAG: small multi-drug export protein [Patescibacteria group bacterium]
MFQEIFYIFIIAMSPVVEISGAIPLAILTFDFSPLQAYSVALLGNLIPPLFLIPFLGRVDAFLSARSELWQRVFGKFLARTKDNHIKKFEVMKELVLFVLLVIPTPLTGVWTASLLSHIFGISLRKAYPLIVFGQLIAGIVVIGATLGISAIF